MTTSFALCIALCFQIISVFSWPLWSSPPAVTNCNHYHGMPVNECSFISSQNDQQSSGYYCIDANTIEYRDFYGPNCHETHFLTSHTLQCGEFCECSLQNECDSTNVFYKWCDETSNRVDHSKVIVDQCVTNSLTTSYSYHCNENGQIGMKFYGETADCSADSNLSFLPDTCENVPNDQYSASCVVF